MLKKRVRLFAAVMTILAGAMCAQAVFADDAVKVFYSGEEIVYDVAPQIVAERTMVPLRTTIETITGEPMEWDENTKTVTFKANGHTNTHTVGQKAVYVDGVPVEFDTPSLIIDSRTLVPVRMIAETSGCSVDWDPNARYVLITPPAASEPPEPAGEQPSIASVVTDKATINEGETTILAIKTNAVVSNVWVDDGGNNAQAAYQATDSSGVKTWTVICKPVTSRSVIVYANTSQTTEGAASKSQYITVVGAPVSIINVSANKSTVYSGDSVTLTIRTNASAAFVWAEYVGASTNASLQETFANGEKSWSVTFQMDSTQNVRVYANTSKTTVGAAVEVKEISVTEAPAVLLSASADKTAITAGDTVTITASTNASANYAWLYTGTQEVAMSYVSADSSGNKTWTGTVTIYSSGDVAVYTSSTSPKGKDDMKTVSVTVTAQ